MKRSGGDRIVAWIAQQYDAIQTTIGDGPADQPVTLSVPSSRWPT
jgi:hypothetical protein